MLYSDKPALYIVATPIGHLEDASPRCRGVLEQVDLVAAEDTRVARRLLSAFGIQGKELVSYYDHVEQEKAKVIIERMIEGQLTVALISDAGTPCVADPGYRLVAAAHDAGIPVHPVAGPSALTALVSASGLPNDRVLFLGFLPSKTSLLRQEIAQWSSFRGASIVFFESLRRLSKSLVVLAEHYPKAQIAIGRELSKLYEEVRMMTVDDAIHWVKSEAVLKGEVSVMAHIPTSSSVGESHVGMTEVKLDEMKKAISREFEAGKTLKDLLSAFKDQGLSRSELYQLLLELKPK